jgi:hypothetical protein
MFYLECTHKWLWGMIGYGQQFVQPPRILPHDNEDDVKNNSLNRTDRNTLGRYIVVGSMFHVERVDTFFCGLRD